MKIRESIFAKLIVLFILFCFFINIAVVLFLNYHQNTDLIIQNRKMLAKMEEILAQDLGIPPDSTKAKTISRDYNINIQYKYKDVNWSSSEFIPSVEEITKYEEFTENKKDTNYFSFYYKEKIYGVTKIPDGIIILTYYYNPNEIFDLEKVILAIVIHLSLFFVPLYLLLKWLLNPVKSLSYAVKQIGDGNFDVELSVNRD
ncbi:MAG: hypothetical protein NTU73_06495, partial [Ignavibacteriae bacterium]|nr:hypothetical protein [Ignavibacteriota bacterium]